MSLLKFAGAGGLDFCFPAETALVGAEASTVVRPLLSFSMIFMSVSWWRPSPTKDPLAAKLDQQEPPGGLQGRSRDGYGRRRFEPFLDRAAHARHRLSHKGLFCLIGFSLRFGLGLFAKAGAASIPRPRTSAPTVGKVD